MRTIPIVGLSFALIAHANTLFHDDFSTAGVRLDLSKWTTETGPSSFLGRTQLADWVTPGGVGQFVVGASGAQLALNTYNPTGFSLYGTHAKTLVSFQPTANTAVVLHARLQLTSVQPGLVYGIYFYGCPGPCATQHDEIDIELVTNLLQPGGSPLMVQLNRYANEPLGAGNGGLVNLPASFNPLDPHDWTIRWSLTSIDYFVDGELLGSATTHVPQGPMQVNVISWGPAADWAAAFSPLLQPVSDPAQNQSFVALLTSVNVSSAAPSRIGIFRPAAFMMVAQDINGNIAWDNGIDKATFFGTPEDTIIYGDWDSSETTKVGIFRPSVAMFALDMNGNGAWDPGIDTVGFFGQNGDLPIVGDWNGDGRTKIGIYRPSSGLFALDYNGNMVWDPTADKAHAFGLVGDTPIVGDWTGDGKTKVGIFRNGFWALDTNNDMTLTAGDMQGTVGQAGDTPLLGDWNGDGKTKVGIYRPSVAMFAEDYNGNLAWDNGVDRAGVFGSPNSTPVVGDWTGTGVTRVGVFYGNGYWSLDINGNLTWDAGIKWGGFGAATGDFPVVGKWQ